MNAVKQLASIYTVVHASTQGHNDPHGILQLIDREVHVSEKQSSELPRVASIGRAIDVVRIVLGGRFQISLIVVVHVSVNSKK